MGELLVMKVKQVYFFYDEDTNNLLHLNDCYKFIWEDFDTEELAIRTICNLGVMLHKSFGGDINLQLEIRKKYVVTTGE